MTGLKIQQLIHDGVKPLVTAKRLYGTTYSLGIQLGPQQFAGPVVTPGNEEPLKFESLDEAAAFLQQIGITEFSITL